MRSSKLLLYVAIAILLFFLFGMIFAPVYPSFSVTSHSSWFPSPRPHREDRLGPGGGIQTGANIYLPAHPMPWLGPHGGTQTGANVDLPAHPMPWLGPNGGTQTGGNIDLSAHAL